MTWSYRNNSRKIPFSKDIVRGIIKMEDMRNEAAREATLATLFYELLQITRICGCVGKGV